MTTIVPAALSPRQLAEQVRLVAATPRDWMSRVRLSPDERWYERMHADERYEVWLISWLPGQGTGFHDHGGSAGAFGVVWGTLEEHQAGTAGTARGPSVTVSSVIAVSVHAYSPPLTEMTRYDLSENGLIVLDTEAADQW
jgi:predicted metal-dependent enzyme (double-stranded beta helix superfamily)